MTWGVEFYTGKKAFLDYDVVLFDCDGVLYHGKHAIEGGNELISLLRSKGKKVYFITNSGEKTRQGFAERLKGFGIQIDSDEEMITSAHSVVKYLKTILEPGSKVMNIGDCGLLLELELDGTLRQWVSTQDEEEEIAAIACGLDFDLSYTKIDRAVRVLTNNPKLPFVVTCKDKRWIGEDGKTKASVASCVGSIEACLDDDRDRAIVIGKPSKRMIGNLLDSWDPSKIIMIGDNIDSDFGFANACSIDCALVLSGITKKEDIEKRKPKVSFVFDSVKQIVDACHNAK